MNVLSVFSAFVSFFVSVIFICLSDRLFIYLSCFSAYFSALDQDVLMRMLVLVLVLVGVRAFNRISEIHTAGSEPAL